MTPLRIAMLTTFYPPYSFGGDAVGIQRLARALAARGHHITIIHDTDAYLTLAGKDHPPAPKEDNIDIIGLRSTMGLLSDLLTHQLGTPVVHRARLKEILKPGAFDIIWYHNISLVGGPGLLALGKGLKIYEAHEHWLVCPTHVLWRYNRELCDKRDCLRCTLSYRRPPQLWRATGLLEHEMRHVDAVIAKSEFSRRKHAQFGFRRDMTVVPYFLPEDPADSALADQPPQELPHERPYFLFVGRLEKIKGVQDVIPVFDDYPDADFLVIGDGDYQDALRAQAAANPRIKFLGRLTPDELSRYYKGAIALIVPSVCFETFGIILIESFRKGTPVIARKIGPFTEIVERGRGGDLYSTPEELRAAMASIQANPDRRLALSKAARQGFETFWSESAVMKDYFRLLHGTALAKGDRQLASLLDDQF